MVPCDFGRRTTTSSTNALFALFRSNVVPKGRVLVNFNWGRTNIHAIMMLCVS